jgi:catechol 2,3-dioxygenase-like lactoylglutathione lyase family enzyme
LTGRGVTDTYQVVCNGGDAPHIAVTAAADIGSETKTQGPHREAHMLADSSVQATIAVKDLTAAKKFYGDTLGLEPDGHGDEQVQVYRSGNTRVLVYRSQYAGTNQATAATWNLGGELEKVVNDLKRKGVGFEHYDLPGLTRRGDVHVAGDFKAAWFKDPDGNILAISSA